MTELMGKRVDRALAPGQLNWSLEVWRAARDAEWQELVRHYQEAVTAFRRVVAIAGRRLDAQPARSGAAPTPLRAWAPAPRVQADPDGPSEVGELTARQREIARLIAIGMTNRQIATELVLTEGTVANHVRHILLRLGMRCRAQVAAWVVVEQGRGGPARASRRVGKRTGRRLVERVKTRSSSNGRNGGSPVRQLASPLGGVGRVG